MSSALCSKVLQTGSLFFWVSSQEQVLFAKWYKSKICEQLVCGGVVSKRKTIRMLAFPLSKTSMFWFAFLNLLCQFLQTMKKTRSFPGFAYAAPATHQRKIQVQNFRITKWFYWRPTWLGWLKSEVKTQIHNTMQIYLCGRYCSVELRQLCFSCALAEYKETVHVEKNISVKQNHFSVRNIAII